MSKKYKKSRQANLNPFDGSSRRTTQVHKGKHKYHREDDKKVLKEEMETICPFTLDPCTCNDWTECPEYARMFQT